MWGFCNSGILPMAKPLRDSCAYFFRTCPETTSRGRWAVPQPWWAACGTPVQTGGSSRRRAPGWCSCWARSGLRRTCAAPAALCCSCLLCWATWRARSRRRSRGKRWSTCGSRAWTRCLPPGSGERRRGPARVEGQQHEGFWWLQPTLRPRPHRPSVRWEPCSALDLPGCWSQCSKCWSLRSPRRCHLSPGLKR